jgi:Uma2 family endonuclease
VSTDAIWRFSVDQYHAMIRLGILTEDDPVELLEGWVVTKMPKNPPHSVVTQLTREVLARLLPAGWYADAQEPITTSDSEPEPDVAVVRGDRRQDVALVVEVADSTLQRDRTLKKRLYATAGIPVYWIVNLSNNQIEVYTDPSGPDEQPDYRQQRVCGREDSLPLMIDGHEVARCVVREMLP